MPLKSCTVAVKIKEQNKLDPTSESIDKVMSFVRPITCSASSVWHIKRVEGFIIA